MPVTNLFYWIEIKSMKVEKMMWNLYNYCHTIPVINECLREMGGARSYVDCVYFEILTFIWDCVWLSSEFDISLTEISFDVCLSQMVSA